MKLTQKTILAAAVLCAAGTLAANAQSSTTAGASVAIPPKSSTANAATPKPSQPAPVVAPVINPEPVFDTNAGYNPRVFLTVGPSLSYFSPNGSDAQNLFMYGAAVSAGFYPFDNHRVSLGVGFYTGEKKKADYTESDRPLTATDLEVDRYPENAEFIGMTSTRTYRRETEQFHVPILLSWEYVFTFGEEQDWHFRVGPSIGLTYVNIDVKRSGMFSLQAADGSPYPGFTPFPIASDKTGASGDKFLFSYGVALGLSYDFTKQASRWISPRGNFSLDLQYRFLGNTKLSVGDNSFGTSFVNQLTLSAVWRF